MGSCYQLDERLRNLGLSDLWDGDERPTLALEIAQGAEASPRLSYRNVALLELLQTLSPAAAPASASGDLLAAFVHWATGLDLLQRAGVVTLTAPLGGGSWKYSILRSTWVVIYRASQGKHPALSSPESHINCASSGRSPGHLGRADLASGGGRSSSSAPSYKTISDDGSSKETKNLDWTSSPVAGLSPFVKSLQHHAWELTLLGAMTAWPAQLRQLVLMITAISDPRVIIWGDEHVMIYNEACIPLFGKKHPQALGSPAHEIWPEVWPQLVGIVHSAKNDGIPTKVSNFGLTMERHGYKEETYWTFQIIPVIGPDGVGVAAIDEFTESTTNVVGERRRRMLTKLGERIAGVDSLNDLWQAFLSSIEDCTEDLPFALYYSVTGGDSTGSIQSSDGEFASAISKRCLLEGTAGLPSDRHAAARTFSLSDTISDGGDIGRVCRQAWKLGRIVRLSSDDGTLPPDLARAIPGRAFDANMRSVLVIPITSVVETGIAGFLILGLNPQRPYDEEYQLFTHLLSDVLAKSAVLISMPEEQRRAQQTADEIHKSLSQQLQLTTLEAERSEARFTRMAQHSPVGMFSYKSDGTPIHINQSYLDMLGLTQETFMGPAEDGSPWKDIVVPEDTHVVNGAWNRLIELKIPVTVEYRLKRPWISFDKASGSELKGATWMLATAYPELNDDGEIQSVQGWLTDVSHRKFSEQLLSQRLHDALETKRQSENFIDMTSHEMRNPLSAILQSADGIITSLEASGLPILNESMTLSNETAEIILDAAHTIVLCAQHQKRIVDDILTLSKLDSNLLVITPDKIEPSVLVRKALKMFEGELDRAKMEAHLEEEPSYRELEVDFVMVDSSRLLQVIINLLTNAIKFTQYADQRRITIKLGASLSKPTGMHHQVAFIPVRASRPEHSMTPDWGIGPDIYLQFAVQDTGCGLTEDEMKLLFMRFSQASPKTYKQYGGSGLGLFISKELTELQGGQIGVWGEAGKGCTFTFYVKARRWVPSTPGIVAPSMAFERRLSEASTSRAGHTKSAGERMNGVAPDSRRKRHKSFDEKASNLEVLVVEDNLINQRVMAQQLSRLGCKVYVANHGLEALQFLTRTTFYTSSEPLQLASGPGHPSHLDVAGSVPQQSGTAAQSNTTPTIPEAADRVKLSVVLMDLEMPVMDGLTCVRHIRRLETTGQLRSHIPVIAVTANARSEQIATAIEAGMDKVVTKPFRIPDLVPQMERLVGEHESRSS
ncbi:hypothetical protein LTR66_000741 [Elasticomyces elasticus]|nr:hypothetical protein LTR66_000741 [Elasticomyces elasticus]